MQRVQANMTLFYKSNTIAGLLLHVYFVILYHHNCAATLAYLTNTCKNEQTTFVKKCMWKLCFVVTIAGNVQI